MEDTTASGRPLVDREKTAPFLIRTFIKIGSFHRVAQFEEGPLPISDEQQIFTWKDATLRELLTTLRATAPPLPEYRHPLARYSFRALYADSATRGYIAQKDLGIIYSRDILGEPGTLAVPAARLGTDTEPADALTERTLDELRFVPGDYLCVAILLPKNATVAVGPGELAIKGSAVGPPAPATNGWKAAGGRADGGWGGGVASAPGPVGGMGRGGGHWRGDSNAAPQASRGGRGGRGGGGHGRGERDLGDRRVPPPRRDSPPPPRRDTWGDRNRDRDRDRDRIRRGDRRPLSRSRSPPRRNPRYD
ncbi:histone deacetylase complex protein [Amylocystis lapponica]|nr:histone deacetylase complex protein [Amylocystis lapponica]